MTALAPFEIHCPAKLNLFLAIGDRLPDGYHAVETVIAPLALHDTLRLTLTESPDSAKTLFSLSCQNDQGQPVLEDLPPDQNLITQAFLKLQPFLPPGFNTLSLHVTLIKRIPTQAGLGGGSSNAAGLLLALNRWAALPPDDLLNLGRQLGADVSFFLLHALEGLSVIHLTGRGDRLASVQPENIILPTLEDLEIVLIKPHGVGVSTQDAYRWHDDLEHSLSENISSESLLKSLMQEAPVRSWPVYNAFESVMHRHVPQVSEVLHRLQALNADRVVLCGSGATVAGLFQPDPSLKHRIQAEFPDDVYQVIWTYFAASSL